jgi:hypothetical protein
MTLGENAGFPERCRPGTRGRIFLFLVFLLQFFSEAFPHYFKLHVQIWGYLNFFKYISFVFFRFIDFFFANFKFELEVH